MPAPNAGHPAMGNPYAGHPAMGNPAQRPTSEQQAESLRAQQDFIRRQQVEAVAVMARNGLDIPNASWTPPWEYIPHAYASPNNPERQVYIPAFMANPQYSDMPGAGQPAAPMDSAMFPDHYAAVNDVPRIGEVVTNPYTREMTDEFFRAQETRGAPLIAGRQGPHHGQIPH